MPANAANDIPRGSYGLKMASATALGLVLAGVVAAAIGADQKTIGSTVLALAIASVVTFIPVVLRVRAEYWGVAVLASGMGRSLMALAVAYSMTLTDPGLSTRALFMGAVAGAVVILIVESALAIATLSQWDRQRLALKNPEHGTDACS